MEALTTADRIVGLLDHLGIEAAYFATQIPGDIAGFASLHPQRIGGIALVVPMRLDPAPFEGVSKRLLLVAGGEGQTVHVTDRAAKSLAGCEREMLAGYPAVGWSDVAAERTDELAHAMTRFFEQHAVSEAAVSSGACGEHFGLTYRVDGSGPPLVLLPFFLAASQWDPIVPALAQRFAVIRVGGPHIGGIAALEDRASAPTYRAMFENLVDLLEPKPGDAILDVGCGSGALDRLLARRLDSDACIDAVDLNPFFLREARALALRDGLAERIRFSQGSALALPFPDASFDCIFSVTVLEECDADRAIAECVRVARPGARIGIVVRAIDMAQWWNLDLGTDLKAKVSVPPQSVGPGGVADRSLYERMRKAGLVDLVAMPALITLDRPDGPIWRYREDAVLSDLSPSERAEWHVARANAEAAGLLMQSHAMHAAVARKPV
ncbi:MAG: methyltransferase domain-containing protein [Proteobacteria bacterium]|nr:methyltransferase domain-containing protein [Pseudomonadota bacterium]